YHWEDLVVVQPAIRQGVGELIEDHDIVAARFERLATARPTRPGQLAIFLDPVAEPGEATACRHDLHAQPFRGDMLSPPIAFGLDELEHGHAHVAATRPQEDAQRGCGLALPIPRVEENEAGAVLTGWHRVGPRSALLGYRCFGMAG